MARTVNVGQFQRMQKGPNHVGLGEAEALGDATIGNETLAAVDPMSGQVVDNRPGFRSPALSIPEQLAALVLQDDISGMPLGQVVGLVRLAVAKAHVNATVSEIRDEAERRRSERAEADASLGTGYGLEEPPVEPKPEDRADELGERLADRSEDLAGKLGRGREYDVATDGTVRDWRVPDPGPDRGPDVGTTVHTVTDEEPRFSGAGATDEPTVSGLIPPDRDFNGKLYREAPELANIAEQLIQRHGVLEDLQHCDIRWYWKRKTGVSKGRVKIGFMKRASDLLGHFSGADFIGWLSATTARDGRFSSEQVEAAVYHQLLHIGSDDKGNWIFMPHDFEGFGQEVRHYGTWTEGLKLGGQSFVAAHQMGLFSDTDEEEDVAEEVIEQVFGDEPADPDRPYDDEEPDTSGELPTAEEIALSIGRCPHGHAGCDGRHDLADDPLADPAVI